MKAFVPFSSNVVQYVINAMKIYHENHQFPDLKDFDQEINFVECLECTLYIGFDDYLKYLSPVIARNLTSIPDETIRKFPQFLITKVVDLIPISLFDPDYIISHFGFKHLERRIQHSYSPKMNNYPFRVMTQFYEIGLHNDKNENINKNNINNEQNKEIQYIFLGNNDNLQNNENSNDENMNSNDIDNDKTPNDDTHITYSEYIKHQLANTLMQYNYHQFSSSSFVLSNCTSIEIKSSEALEWFYTRISSFENLKEIIITRCMQIPISYSLSNFFLPTLIRLEITKTKLNSNHIKDIINFASENKNLKTLCLRETKMGSVGCELFSEAIKNEKFIYLKNLDIASNGIGGTAMTQLLTEIINIKCPLDEQEEAFNYRQEIHKSFTVAPPKPNSKNKKAQTKQNQINLPQISNATIQNQQSENQQVQTMQPQQINQEQQVQQITNQQTQSLIQQQTFQGNPSFNQFQQQQFQVQKPQLAMQQPQAHMISLQNNLQQQQQNQQLQFQNQQQHPFSVQQPQQPQIQMQQLQNQQIHSHQQQQLQTATQKQQFQIPVQQQLSVQQSQMQQPQIPMQQLQFQLQQQHQLSGSQTIIPIQQPVNQQSHPQIQQQKQFVIQQQILTQQLQQHQTSTQQQQPQIPIQQQQQQPQQQQFQIPTQQQPQVSIQQQQYQIPVQQQQQSQQQFQIPVQQQQQSQTPAQPQQLQAQLQPSQTPPRRQRSQNFQHVEKSESIFRKQRQQADPTFNLSLEGLSIDANFFAPSPESISSLIKIPLRAVSLRGIHWDGESAKMVQKTLEVNEHVKFWDLSAQVVHQHSDPDLSPEIAQEVLKNANKGIDALFFSNHNLQHINLSCIVHLTNLKALTLTNSNLMEDSVEVIEPLLNNLSFLDLSYNSIVFRNNGSFLKSCVKSPTLKYLFLSSNDIGDNGGKVIFDTMKEIEGKTMISTLRLRNCALRHKSSAALLDLLATGNINFVELDIGGNDMFHKIHQFQDQEEEEANDDNNNINNGNIDNINNNNNKDFSSVYDDVFNVKFGVSLEDQPPMKENIFLHKNDDENDLSENTNIKKSSIETFFVGGNNVDKKAFSQVFDVVKDIKFLDLDDIAISAILNASKKFRGIIGLSICFARIQSLNDLLRILQDSEAQDLWIYHSISQRILDGLMKNYLQIPKLMAIHVGSDLAEKKIKNPPIPIFFEEAT